MYKRQVYHPDDEIWEDSFRDPEHVYLHANPITVNGRYLTGVINQAQQPVISWRPVSYTHLRTWDFSDLFHFILAIGSNFP